MVRGALNQPEAIREERAGKTWDEKERSWKQTPGDAIVADDPKMAEARRNYNRSHNTEGGEAGTSSDGKAFPHYYNLLGVEVRLPSLTVSALCPHSPISIPCFSLFQQTNDIPTGSDSSSSSFPVRECRASPRTWQHMTPG